MSEWLKFREREAPRALAGDEVRCADDGGSVLQAGAVYRVIKVRRHAGRVAEFLIRTPDGLGWYDGRRFVEHKRAKPMIVGPEDATAIAEASTAMQQWARDLLGTPPSPDDGYGTRGGPRVKLLEARQRLAAAILNGERDDLVKP